MAETATGGGGPGDNPREARWLPVGIMFALALIGGAVLAWTNEEFKLTAYRTGLMVFERLANAEPGLQGAVSIAHEWIGDVLYDQGKLNEALGSYRACLAIREQLTKDQPSITAWQIGLASMQSRIGDVLSDQGNREDALASYLASLAIREQLAADNPDNARLQRDLSVSHVRVGDALHLQGKFDKALASYRDSLAIRERLAKTDASNAEVQHDLSVVLGRVGNVLAAQGEVDEARASFRDALAIAERVAATNTSNADWRWDVVLWQSELAQGGDDPERRWAFIVAEMRKLIGENLLRPDRARFLSVAEQQLAKVREAQATPQRATTSTIMNETKLCGSCVAAPLGHPRSIPNPGRDVAGRSQGARVETKGACGSYSLASQWLPSPLPAFREIGVASSQSCRRDVPNNPH